MALLWRRGAATLALVLAFPIFEGRPPFALGLALESKPKPLLRSEAAIRQQRVAEAAAEPQSPRQSGAGAAGSAQEEGEEGKQKEVLAQKSVVNATGGGEREAKEKGDGSEGGPLDEDEEGGGVSGHVVGVLAAVGDEDGDDEDDEEELALEQAEADDIDGEDGDEESEKLQDLASLLEELDLDRDGKVSEAEVVKREERLRILQPEWLAKVARQHFLAADKDGDGLLDEEELLELESELGEDNRFLAADSEQTVGRQHLLEELDTDKDGKVSFEEVAAKARQAGAIRADKIKEVLSKHFKAADGDQDHFLNQTELLAFHRAEAANRERFLTKIGERAAKAAAEEEEEEEEDEDDEEDEDEESEPGGGGGGDDGPDARSLLQDMDSDGDGKVSLKEAVEEEVAQGIIHPDKIQELVGQHFREADSNGDGFLDVAEVPALRQGLEADDRFLTVLGARLYADHGDE